MTQRKETYRALREMIDNTRSSIPNGNSAPAVVSALMRDGWSAIVENDDVLRAIVAAGLNAEVRRAMKMFVANGVSAVEARQRQIEMFPPDARKFVADIDHEYVFVSSRDEHVELTPDAMTPDEMREAGRYLICQGEDTMRRGRNLISLADIMESEQAAA